MKPFEQQDIANLLVAASHSYARELLKADLFQNESEAVKAAEYECYNEEPSEQNHFFRIVSSKDQQPYGYVWYSIKGKEVYLKDIFLKEEYRGHGMGTQILQNLECECRQRGLDSIGLHVFAHNQRAYGLYKRLGYEVWLTNMNEGKIVGFVMRKDLRIR